MSKPICCLTPEACSCIPEDHVIIPRAQYEAWRAAEMALHDLIIGSNKKGCISRGHDALAALRAAGIEIEG